MNQIDIELYKTFSKKELVFWCKIIASDDDSNEFWKHWFWTIIKDLRWDWLSMLVDKWDQLEYYVGHNEEFKFEILGTEPRLEDVFQKAKENELICELAISSFTDDFKLMFSKWTTTLESFYYNQCESLLNQTDETKTELLKLFE